MCLVILIIYDQDLFTWCWNMKVMYLSLNYFRTFLFSLSLAQFSALIRDTLGRARNVLLPGVLNVPPELIENEWYELPLLRLVILIFFRVLTWSSFNHRFLWRVADSSFWWLNSHVKSSVSMNINEYQWISFWIPVGESFKKTFLEKWVFVDDDLSDDQNIMDLSILHSTNPQITVDTSLWLPEFRKNSLLYLGNPRSLKVRLYFFTTNWDFISSFTSTT